MKKSLKIILIITTLFLTVVALAGCGKQTEQPKENKEVKEQENNETTTDNFSRGEWKSNQYVNDFAKIKFNMPDTWVKYSDEKIAEMMNIGKEALSEDQKKLAELAEQTTIYGMVANDTETGANISILLEKPVMQVTSETYVNMLKKQLETVEEVKYKIEKTTTEKVANQDYTALTVTADVSGIQIEQCYYVKEQNGYIITIIVTTTGDGQLEKILSYFE